MTYEFGNDPVEDYCRARKEQFDAITNIGYFVIIIACALSVLFIFA